MPPMGQPGAQRSGSHCPGTPSGPQWQWVPKPSCLTPKAYQGNKGCFSSSTVKPDPPKNLQLELLKNSRHAEVTWEYPDTWSTPHSYFSLTFCVQVQSKNKKEKVRCGPGTACPVRSLKAHIRKKAENDLECDHSSTMFLEFY